MPRPFESSTTSCLTEAEFHVKAHLLADGLAACAGPVVIGITRGGAAPASSLTADLCRPMPTASAHHNSDDGIRQQASGIVHADHTALRCVDLSLSPLIRDDIDSTGATIHALSTPLVDATWRLPAGRGIRLLAGGATRRPTGLLPVGRPTPGVRVLPALAWISVQPFLAGAACTVIATTAPETFCNTALESLSVATPIVTKDLGHVLTRIGTAGTVVPTQARRPQPVAGNPGLTCRSQPLSARQYGRPVSRSALPAARSGPDAPGRRLPRAPRSTGATAVTVFGLYPGQQMLKVAPHPDNETLGCDGTVRWLVTDRVAVHVLAVTIRVASRCEAESATQQPSHATVSPMPWAHRTSMNVDKWAHDDGGVRHQHAA